MSRYQLLSRYRVSRWIHILTGVMICCGASGAAADAGATTSAIRVVGCNQNVQSHKRGVCENQLEEADFRALAPGVSWYYNWNYETQDMPPADVLMDYILMIWGEQADSLVE